MDNTKNTELVKTLRELSVKNSLSLWKRGVCNDAAAAIEALQAEVAELKRVNMEIFEDLPKRGEWKYIVYHNGCTPDEDIVCSVCGKSGLDYWNYCPNCGAKMGGSDESLGSL